MSEAERHLRTTIPPEVAKVFHHLAIDLGVTRQQLMREAIWLLLEQHGVAGGLTDRPVPTKPRLS